MTPVERALRSLIADLDYDIHKAIECNEDDGTDGYPALAEEFAELLAFHADAGDK